MLSYSTPWQLSWVSVARVGVGVGVGVVVVVVVGVVVGVYRSIKAEAE